MSDESSPPVAVALDPADGGWRVFGGPRGRLECDSLAAVRPVLAELTRRVETEGLWAVGFVAYEAAPAFDDALAVRPPDPAAGLPLVRFELFAEARRVAETAAALGGAGEYRVGEWRSSIGERRYRQALAEIRRRIAAGDTYQVNFTYRRRARFAGDPRGLFLDLVRGQLGPAAGGVAPTAGCAVYLDAGRYAVACASPELFFATASRRVSCRPMKGTAARGLWAADDDRRAAALAASEKERAENLMIVDMVRNDLGRVAVAGSVAVPELFTVERYPAVLQLTSTVTAESAAPWPELFAALFPCASITGAPKPATSRIIAELEDGPRGIYTGAVGWLAPGGRSRFAVGIRTAVVDRRRGLAEFGAGGGIVWDSAPAAELAESRIKAAILPRGGGPRAAAPPFALLETLRWQADRGYLLLAGHLERLRGSAGYFGFRLDEAAVRRALDAAAASATAGTLAATGEAGHEAGAPWRVRLVVAADGGVRAVAEPLRVAIASPPERAPPAAGAVGDPPSRPEPGASVPAVAFATTPVDPPDPFLYHKTTRRAVYERALAEARSRVPEAVDALLRNPRGEVTESTIANLVAEVDGERVTPPLACGLLPGVLRAHLLATGEVRERRLAASELAAAPRLWLVSALRGWRRVRLAGWEAPAGTGLAASSGRERGSEGPGSPLSS